MLDSVMTAGIDRSIPRAMRTRVSPMAAMPRNAANGMTARKVEGRRLRGTIIGAHHNQTRPLRSRSP